MSEYLIYLYVLVKYPELYAIISLEIAGSNSEKIQLSCLQPGISKKIIAYSLGSLVLVYVATIF